MSLFRFSIRRARAGVPSAAVLLASLLPAALAAQIPCDTSLGTRAIAIGGPVTVRILAAGADFTSEISVLKNGATVGEFHFPLGSSQDAGVIVDAGVFVANAELQFFIAVDQTGYEFSTGPASRNLDGLAHAKVTQLDGDSVRVGFEDFLGESDRDFDDVVFEVDGAHPQIYFAGLPTEPGGLSRLGCDARGNLVASPLQLGGSLAVDLSLGSAGGWGTSGRLETESGDGGVQVLARGVDGVARTFLRARRAAASPRPPSSALPTAGSRSKPYAAPRRALGRAPFRWAMRRGISSSTRRRAPMSSSKPFRRPRGGRSCAARSPRAPWSCGSATGRPGR